MSEFHIREHANQSPTKCFTCDTHQGPFIDTEVDLIGWGHLWICVGTEERPGCLLQMARLAGCAEPAEHKRLKDRIDDQNKSIRAKNERIRELVAKSPITIEDLRAAGLVVHESDETPSLAY